MINLLEKYAFDVSLWLYAIGALIFLLYAVTEQSRLATGAMAAVGTGLLAHTVGLTARTVNIGRLPFANMYEFIVFFAWGLVLVYFVTQRRHPVPLLGAAIMPVAVILMSAARIMTSPARPLMPALQSYWLQSHVATAVLAYGAFGVSFGIGILYLIKDSQPVTVSSTSLSTMPQGSSLLPSTETLDKLMYRVIACGFFFLTLVLITGAVWAEQVWGAWWSWDPKETWALITWLVYAVYLHGRFTRGWRGRRAAWMAVFGFVAVMFTLFGVTWLMPGMHSYS
ncbi:cytochrome c-type biogenesis protein CcsB [Desulfotomaculum nigrificans CO-1-SRB]|uniref:Heme exporter protein C n=1 Tax=Desulfotomaculum nigrificans (strain DSM 14880 / VKM B-2319 / CO-1-SRB) TaxID=868595 RepID=F6B3B5_DESCC|nr:c-type cytochrome biogenesis protein CcsB [Desulfotomaculum nigrificans]AEF95146.1 cytochrome c-type biogenesis protein CcsB [Desulfotomaculum nigrificans CO-1-SRB]